jgi:hypothetical protein
MVRYFSIAIYNTADIYRFWLGVQQQQSEAVHGTSLIVGSGCAALTSGKDVVHIFRRWDTRIHRAVDTTYTLKRLYFSFSSFL